MKAVMGSIVSSAVVGQTDASSEHVRTSRQLPRTLARFPFHGLDMRDDRVRGYSCPVT
jgi:hypothetical protein